MGQRYHQFTLEERCRIAQLHEAGQSYRQIAASLDRAPSSIAREVTRNRSAQSGYQPAYADDLAWSRRWQGMRLERDPILRDMVLSRLAIGWSPEQVAGRLDCVGKETIYRFIHAQIARTKDYRWRHYLPRGKSKRGWRGRRAARLPCISRGASRSPSVLLSPERGITKRTPCCSRPTDKPCSSLWRSSPDISR